MKEWIRKHDIVLTLMLVIAVMAVIFFFSSQSGPESRKASGSVIVTAQQILDAWKKTDSGRLRMLMSGRYATVFVRKTAHICEYAALGSALMLHCHVLAEKRKLRRPVLPAFLVGVLYGGTDELHQLIVSGRKGSLSDVVIDSIGVALGIALMLLALRLAEQRRRRREEVLPPKY